MNSPRPEDATNRERAERIEFTARYELETWVAPSLAAEVIAGEQSSGTFLKLPGETQDLKERFRARVTRVEELGPVPSATLRSALAERRGHTGTCRRALIEVAFPVDNVGANLVTLMATVAGNLFELGEVTGLRLLDIDLPQEYAARFQGPQFGISGTREKAGVFERALIGTIIKPSVGLTPEATAALVDELCAADIDFIKDDELLADPPYAPFAQRLAAVMPVLHRHADRRGRMPMYAINISGGIDEMRRRHDAVVKAGGTCVMVSMNWAGLAALEHLRSYAQVPIHGHRNGWGALTRHPSVGFEFMALQKIWRLAGVDHIHVNGLRSKFWEPDDSVIRSARACLMPFAGIEPAIPVFSSAQWAGLAPDLYRQLNSTDLMHLAGGGIIGHPDGIAAGVASMRLAWEAAVEGKTLEEAARGRSELGKAIEAFGVAK